MNIGYVTEIPYEWNKALTSASTLDKLKSLCTEFELVAWDAKDIADTMTEADFKCWRKGLAKERKGVFAGYPFAEKFGAILLPELMMKVSLIASQFMVPWGCAFIRCRDEGVVTIVNGRAKFNQPS